jgi:uncharacterized protein (DUF433 family)
MAEALTTEPIPLVFGPDGVMRVRGTRVTLETVLAAFAEGATAEEIAQQYPSILLADVYQVIGYGLRHSSELEAYLARRRQDNRETRRSNESRWPPDGIRDRLIARRQGQCCAGWPTRTSITISSVRCSAENPGSTLFAPRMPA